MHKRPYPYSTPRRVRVAVEGAPRIAEKITIRDPLPLQPSTDMKFRPNDPRAIMAENATAVYVLSRLSEVLDPNAKAWRKLFEIAAEKYPSYFLEDHKRWFSRCLERPNLEIRNIAADEDPTDVIIWGDQDTLNIRVSYSTTHAPHLDKMRVWLAGYLMLKHPRCKKWIFHPVP